MAASQSDLVTTLLLSSTLKLFVPRQAQTVAEWVRSENIRITAGINPSFEGQPFDPETFPAPARAVLGFIQSESPADRELIVMKDSQSCGFTTLCAIAAGWTVKFAPGNSGFWLDTHVNAQAVISKKLDPFWHQMPHMVQAWEEGGGDRFQRNEHRRYGPLFFDFVGSGSASGFISSTVAYAYLDECGVHEPINGISSIDLARKRLTAVRNSKLLAGSKPEDPQRIERDESGAWRAVLERGSSFHGEYLSGTQEKYHVPCPMCGTFQELVWEGICYEHCNEALPGAEGSEDRILNTDRVMRETFYRCSSHDCRDRGPECEEPCYHPEAKWSRGAIAERWKPWMVRHPESRWVPLPPERREARELYPRAYPGRRSVHVSALYNPALPSVSWGNLALEYEAARSDSSKMRAFFRDRLGLPKSSQESVVQPATHKLLHKLIPGSRYRRLFLMDSDRRAQAESGARGGVLTVAPDLMGSTRSGEPRPGWPMLTGLIVDVQKGALKWMLVCYDRHGAPWVHDWGVIGLHRAEIHIKENLRDLARLRESTVLRVHNPEGGYLDRGIDGILIDARYMSTEVLAWAQALQRQGVMVFPVWGDPMANVRARGRGDLWFQIHHGSGYHLQVLHLNHNHWAAETRINRIDNGRLSAPSAESPPIRFPADILSDPAFCDEVLNQHVEYVESGQGDIKEMRWVKVVKKYPDDYFDCLKWSPIYWRAAVNPESIPKG